MKAPFENAASRTVDSAGAVYSFREIGDGARTPLVFLNYLATVLEDRDADFVAGLAAHHRIIIFDHSSRDGAVTRATTDNVADMARDAIKFIAALGLKLVDLVEFSAGAFVAQRIVHERPDLVRRIFLAGAVPPDDGPLTDDQPAGVNFVRTNRPP